jgi:hypothetical protein
MECLICKNKVPIPTLFHLNTKRWQIIRSLEIFCSTPSPSWNRGIIAQLNSVLASHFPTAFMSFVQTLWEGLGCVEVCFTLSFVIL